MSRWGLVSLLALASAVPAAASPMAAGTLTVKPNAPSTGSHLVVDAGANDAGFRKGQIPQGFAIGFQKGFVLDTTAVAGTCTTGQATKDACPANSVLGTGQIDVNLNGGTYHAAITFFRSTTANGVIFYFKEPQSGFNGASEGTLKTGDAAPYDDVLEFDKLPLPDLPPGLDLQLTHLSLDIGAGSATPAKKPATHKKKPSAENTQKLEEARREEIAKAKLILRDAERVLKEAQERFKGVNAAWEEAKNALENASRTVQEATEHLHSLVR